MSKKLPADFPKSPAEWEAIIAAAPGADRPPTPQEQAQWDNAVVVREGGPQAVREALAARRTRGPGKKPAKELVSLRIPPDILARWKATGDGWQTRMVDRLSKHAP
jgi:uncharacterized protein (DUF4415 family)